ncbi:MAG: NAD-dependent epimerase/dehydratase family protein, partial [Granulosicoccus sp.]
MKKRVLVTGGLGFIGLHLCKQLLTNQPDTELTIVDNLSSTRLDYSELLHQANIHIADMRVLDEANADYHEIYHLASPVGSIGILERNGYIASDIIELATKAARLAMASGASLLYLSSSEVYGRDGQHQEGNELVVPNKRGARMEYSLGKLAAEHVLFNLAMDDLFKVRVVRPFNVAGEWQSAQLGFVIPRFFNAALNGEPLTVHGDGLQRRSFCHVSDLVKGVIAVQQHAPANEVFNVGNPNNIVTIKQLAEDIVAITGSSSPIIHVDPHQTYGKRYMEAFDKIPDIEKLAQYCDW